MFRGFLNKSKTEEIKINEEFWSAIVKYSLDTLHGIHSGFAKLYLGIVPCPPSMKEMLAISRIGDHVFYAALTKNVEGYVNKTAESFVTRDDEYVNGVFDNFKMLLGGKLPCCFYHHVVNLMSEVINELAKDQQLDIPPTFTAQQVLESYLYHLDLFIMQFLEERKANFLAAIKQDMKNCTKGMDKAISVKGSFFKSASNDDDE